MSMAGFVPRGKMSKKAQKELNRQRRVTWEFSPVTKTVESKKLYNRKKNTRNRYDESGSGVFHYQDGYQYLHLVDSEVLWGGNAST